MNLTIVLVSKRSIELLLVLVCLFALVACRIPSDAAASKGDHEGKQKQLSRLDSLKLEEEARSQDEAATSISANKLESVYNERALADEKRELTGDEFSKIVQRFGEELSGQMDAELGELIQAAGAAAARRNESERQQRLERMRAARESASEDIKTRIQLVGDGGSSLPQLSFGSRASSLLSQANERLQLAGFYIGNKLSSLGAHLAPRVPARLRRFFRWPSFLKFKLMFNKNYKTLREEIYRQMLFLRAHIHVGIQHVRFLLGRDKHLLGATQFADWTREEYRDKLSNRRAERSAADADQSALDSFEAQYKAKLGELRARNQTISGVSLGEFANKRQANKLAPPDKLKREHGNDDDDDDDEKESGADGKRARRSKRSGSADDADEDDADELDELNESEDDDFSPGYEILSSITLDDDEDDSDLDPEKLIEEFANAQLNDLDELSRTLDGVIKDPAAPSSSSYNPAIELDGDDIPEVVDSSFVPIDLRQTGCIIRPENQESCGCCYAFALNTAAAYYNCMENYHENEKLVRYSPFYTAQCGRYYSPIGQYPLINGCGGGRLSKAFMFTQLVGVQRHSDYTCAEASVRSAVGFDQCIYPRPTGALDMSFSNGMAHEVPMFTRSRFVNMKLNEVDLHLRTVGPVFVNIRTWKDFGLMKAGIYGGIEEDTINDPSIHSMLIVGHDKDLFNRDYWIICNSHGVNWAERGFVRVYTRTLKHFKVYVGGLQAQLY